MPILPPVVVDDVFEIVVRGSQGAGGSSVTPAGNRFFYRRTGGPAAVLAALVTAFRAAVVAPHLLAANQRYAVNRIDCRKVNTPNDPGIQVADAGVGAIATDGQPSDDCAVINLKSGIRGKSGRGFKHFAGVNEVDTTLDVLVGAGLARWQAVRDGCKAALVDATGTTYTPFILSPTWSQIETDPVSILGANVTDAKLNTVVASLRKRKAASILS